MRTICATAFFLIVVAASGRAQTTERFVTANGHSLHFLVSEPRPARAGAPTLLFESGLGDSGGGVWDKLWAVLPTDVRLVTYDRPGLGASDDDRELPTPRRIASVLHEALEKLNLRPPYVLIGHSLGALRIRTFAAMYPNEVAGLVFVDPVDFTARQADALRDIWVPLGLGTSERDEFERSSLAQVSQLPAPVKRELDVALHASSTDYEEVRSLPPLPDVPLIVLIAQQRAPAGRRASFDVTALYRQIMTVRIGSLTRFAATLSRSEVIVTSNPDHGLQRSDPHLVALAIERVMSLVGRPKP